MYLSLNSLIRTNSLIWTLLTLKWHRGVRIIEVLLYMYIYIYMYIGSTFHRIVKNKTGTWCDQCLRIFVIMLCTPGDLRNQFRHLYETGHNSRQYMCLCILCLYVCMHGCVYTYRITLNYGQSCINAWSCLVSGIKRTVTK